MRLRNISIYSLILFSILDVVTTLIVKAKHPILNESNLIVIFAGSLWLMFIIKILVVSYLVYSLSYKYTIQWPTTLRYITIYFFVLVTLLTIGAVFNNLYVYNLPSEMIEPIPDDVKIEGYVKAVGDLELVTDNISVPKRNTPLIVYLFGINLIQFMVWRSFEKNATRNK